MHQKKVIKTIVCGVGFGQFYLEAIQLIKDEVKLIGILSNGSEKSKKCAEYYGVDLYTDIDDVPSYIDLACVVVKSESMGGQGVNLAIDFLQRNVNVILEHPVCHKNIAKCMKTAREHNVFFKVGDLYTNLPSVEKYTDCTKELLKKQKPQYIEIQCSTRVLFPMVHILSKLLTNISPIKIVNCTKGSGIYQIISGTIGKIPFLLKANNEININEPDSYIREFHSFSIDVQGGRLILTDTHGPVIWQPILKLPTLDIEPKDRFTKYPRELFNESTKIIGDEKAPSYDVILSKLWPTAIAKDIKEIRGMILDETKKEYDLCNMQQMILYAKLWQQLTKELGYPELNNHKNDVWVDPSSFEK
ncbi:Gfo/Idh/MocA family oxidoreductase [Vallitalea sp.]|jgi:thiazolinyl imide reductase|uniref:Gfo/Idh/MocA family oxidoreductase n=1 Tax=Vallitalea sp. TaxID=1882829 RepID=UPI0025CC9B14|nr:Gfo/Idh/MocA family oxidoreductase [Vallitalea sp.]MCT4687860.1 Gfo/Idh/MocA family oxidoreductase [Vallitalea sp.]